MYLDVEELLELNDLLTGNVKSTKVITISGDGIDKSLVMRVKKYSLLKEILLKYFVLDKDTESQLLSNIYMQKSIKVLLAPDKINLNSLLYR